MGGRERVGALMNWIEHAADAIWAAVLYVFNSIAFAVFAGAMAKHALDVQAGKHAFFGVVLRLRLIIGISLSIIALGVVEKTGLTGWTANAVANLIGFGGIELVLSIALSRLRAKGLIADLAAAAGQEEETKP